MTTPVSYRLSPVRKSLPRFFQYLILSIVVVLVFVPVIILVFGALKTRGEFMTHPYTLPIPPHWENLTLILGKSSYSFWMMMRNSLLVMLATTSGVVIICSLAAFVFARMEFRSKNLAFNLFTLGLMFPINIAILPVYFVLRQMHLIDSLWGVILVQTAFTLSGNILILRGFFTAIPAELQDAAYIDGCTALDFFWRILLPLARPALSAVAALTKDLSLVSAFVALSAIPTIIFYLLAERQIVSWLTAGAIKG